MESNYVNMTRIKEDYEMFLSWFNLESSDLYTYRYFNYLNDLHNKQLGKIFVTNFTVGMAPTVISPALNNTLKNIFPSIVDL